VCVIVKSGVFWSQVDAVKYPKRNKTRARDYIIAKCLFRFRKIRRRFFFFVRSNQQYIVWFDILCRRTHTYICPQTVQYIVRVRYESSFSMATRDGVERCGNNFILIITSYGSVFTGRSRSTGLGTKIKNRFLKDTEIYAEISYAHKITYVYYIGIIQANVDNSWNILNEKKKKIVIPLQKKV